jgi:hypothetical protein
MEVIPFHVESKARTQPKKWKQIMDSYQELTCLIDIANRTVASIIWRTIKNKQIKYFAWETHLGVDELSLWVTILKIRHLVDKLSK